MEIKYPHPFFKNKQGIPQLRRYYPDFYIAVKKGDNIQKYIVEVKPFKETRPPGPKGKKNHKTLLEERKRWAINEAKWKAANRLCNKMGWIFKIITEKELLR